MLNRKTLLISTLAALICVTLAADQYRRKKPWTRSALGFLLYSFGATKGCSLRECVYPLENDIRELIKTLSPRSRVVERTPDGLELWETPDGAYWVPRGNALLSLIAEQMADVYQLEAPFVRRNGVFVDCGANVGTFTRKALRNGASLVVAIDVDPVNCICLRKTFHREISTGKVVVVEKGVWDRLDKMTLHVYSNSALNSIVMANRSDQSNVPQREITVPLTTIDSLLHELNLERVDFIKMDIEGAERRAIQGARNAITRFQPVLSIATENLEDDYDESIRLLRTLAPAYQFRAGRCIRPSRFQMRPEALIFFPPSGLKPS